MIRIIYDKCTPTRDRRPTTAEDIRNDFVIKDFETKEQLLDELYDIANMEPEDVYDETDITEDDLDGQIDYIMGFFEDPGDGSPNILYLNIDGVNHAEAYPYDELANLDLQHITLPDLIDYELDRHEADEEEFENYFGYKLGKETWEVDEPDDTEDVPTGITLDTNE